MTQFGPVATLDGVATSCRKRDDGWPLCPSCGTDELASQDFLQWKGGQRPAFPPTRGFDDFICYYCQWRGRIVWAETP